MVGTQNEDELLEKVLFWVYLCSQKGPIEQRTHKVNTLKSMFSCQFLQYLVAEEHFQELQELSILPASLVGKPKISRQFPMSLASMCGLTSQYSAVVQILVWTCICIHFGKDLEQKLNLMLLLEG